MHKKFVDIYMFIYYYHTKDRLFLVMIKDAASQGGGKPEI